MEDMYIKSSDVIKKLNYIFRTYGVSPQMKEVYKSAIAKLPYVVKGELETTLDSAADVQPVAHGEWIDKPYERWKAYDIRYCSKCNWSIHKNKLRCADLNWSYCPNCGAKMDLER